MSPYSSPELRILHLRTNVITNSPTALDVSNTTFSNEAEFQAPERLSR